MFKLSLLSAFLICAVGQAGSTMLNAEKMREFYGIKDYSLDKISKLKIAVIDNGFKDLTKESGHLPASAEIVETYSPELIKSCPSPVPGTDAEPPVSFSTTEHGRMMAQIVWGMTGQKEAGPQFYLLNANGISNFRRAVCYAIQAKVDIILYSHNRECCSNFRGDGFINDIVNKATSAGILWVNAAGNYGGRVFNSPLAADADGTVRFGETTQLRIKSYWDNNPAQIVLAYASDWSEENAGTDKDLNLFLYDPDGKQVASSELRQVKKKAALGENETYLARESIKYIFSRKDGHYTVKVKKASGQIVSSDFVRITVISENEPFFLEKEKRMADPVELVDASPNYEIMAPADNATVIAVGDLSRYSSWGPTLDGREKPDLVLERSEIDYSNGKGNNGTSNAAALFAGIAAVLKANDPTLVREDFLKFVSSRARRTNKVAEAKVEAMPVSFLPDHFTSLVEYLEAKKPNVSSLAGKYQSGRWAIAYTTSPVNILETLCGELPVRTAFNEISDDTEYFVAGLTKGTKEPACYSRGSVLCCVRNPSGTHRYYPWDYSGREASRYLEIRQAVTLDAGGKPSETVIELPKRRVWKTPTLTELRSRN